MLPWVHPGVSLVTMTTTPCRHVWQPPRKQRWITVRIGYRSSTIPLFLLTSFLRVGCNVWLDGIKDALPLKKCWEVGLLWPHMRHRGINYWLVGIPVLSRAGQSWPTETLQRKQIFTCPFFTPRWHVGCKIQTRLTVVKVWGKKGLVRMGSGIWLELTREKSCQHSVILSRYRCLEIRYFYLPKRYIL